MVWSLAGPLQRLERAYSRLTLVVTLAAGLLASHTCPGAQPDVQRKKPTPAQSQASAATDQPGQIRAAKDGAVLTERTTLNGHGDRVWAVSFSHEGSTLASVGGFWNR